MWRLWLSFMSSCSAAGKQTCGFSFFFWGGEELTSQKENTPLTVSAAAAALPLLYLTHRTPLWARVKPQTTWSLEQNDLIELSWEQSNYNNAHRTVWYSLCLGSNTYPSHTHTITHRLTHIHTQGGRDQKDVITACGRAKTKTAIKHSRGRCFNHSSQTSKPHRAVSGWDETQRTETGRSRTSLFFFFLFGSISSFFYVLGERHTKKNRTQTYLTLTSYKVMSNLNLYLCSNLT